MTKINLSKITLWSAKITLLATLTFSSALLSTALLAQAAESILFIGNSFTFGYGSAARYYRADSVTDLNKEGTGGVPALFKSFADQAGLDFDVSIETYPGAGLDFHLENRLELIGQQPWDHAVMHGFSTLDRDAPGNPAKLIETAAEMAAFLRGLNASTELYLSATWSRADMVYPEDKPWHGTPIEQMAIDIRAGYDEAAQGIGATVNPVGEAWSRAMATGVADPNPYDGIAPGQVDLWTWDHYHASSYGYYLEALVVFGNVTGKDPRSLGRNECSGYELGFSPAEVAALQQVAFDQLDFEGKVTAAPLNESRVIPRRCAE